MGTHLGTDGLSERNAFRLDETAIFLVLKIVPIPRQSSSQNRDHPIWMHPYHEIFEFQSPKVLQRDSNFPLSSPASVSIQAYHFEIQATTIL